MATRYAQMNALRVRALDQTETLRFDLWHACGVWDTMPEVLTELVRTSGFDLGALRPEESIEYCALVAVIQDFASFELLDAVFATAAAVAGNGAVERRDILDIGLLCFSHSGNV